MKRARTRQQKALGGRLSNYELAAAIAFTVDDCRSLGTGVPRFKSLHDHLDKLLAEQAKRATKE